MGCRVFIHAASPIHVVVSSMARVRPFGISVVIPNYNRTEPLRAAIESVVTSPGSPVEIVVVDDASTENPGNHIPPTNSSGVPVRFVTLGGNSGPQSARNMGMRRARYEFIAFLDSDDKFTGDKVPRVLDALRRNDVDVLFHGVTGMEKYALLSRMWARFRRVVPFTWFLAICNPMATCSLVVRNVGRLGVPRMRYCEDYAFLLHYVQAETRIAYLDSYLSSVERPPGKAGGLSAARWNMRKGEFKARQLLLREYAPGAVIRWCLGGGMGCLRIVGDIVRGRYLNIL